MGQAGQSLTQESVTATETVKQESQNSTSNNPEVAVLEAAAAAVLDPVEVSDGEIMDGEEPSAELIKMNKM